jgi:hypothetical protein
MASKCKWALVLVAVIECSHNNECSGNKTGLNSQRHCCLLTQCPLLQEISTKPRPLFDAPGGFKQRGILLSLSNAGLLCCIFPPT